MKLMQNILRELNEKIESQISKRNKEEYCIPFPKTEITILGQFSLMSNSKISARLNLVATMDVDALIEGADFVKESFKTILRKHGLHYDEDSYLIWIPPESKYEVIYETNNLRCKAISPIFALLSKAIKAKEKNRILIKEAVGIFGDKLTELIKKYGGDPDYFLR